MNTQLIHTLIVGDAARVRPGLGGDPVPFLEIAVSGTSMDDLFDLGVNAGTTIVAQSEETQGVMATCATIWGVICSG
jgi:hypothetical protein